MYETDTQHGYTTHTSTHVISMMKKGLLTEGTGRAFRYYWKKGGRGLSGIGTLDSFWRVGHGRACIHDRDREGGAKEHGTPWCGL